MVEVDDEVLPAEAILSSVLRGGAGGKRPDQNDAVEAGGVVHAGDGGVTAVDPVRPGKQAQPPEAGVDAGQGLAVLAAPLEQTGPPDPREREAQQPVGTVALGEPVAEVGQDAVVEAGVFQLQSEGVL